jgi:hypothetical protein
MNDLHDRNQIDKLFLMIFDRILFVPSSIAFTSYFQSTHRSLQTRSLLLKDIRLLNYDAFLFYFEFPDIFPIYCLGMRVGSWITA